MKRNEVTAAATATAKKKTQSESSNERARPVFKWPTNHDDAPGKHTFFFTLTTGR